MVLYVHRNHKAHYNISEGRMEVGEEGDYKLCLSLYCHHQNDSSNKSEAEESQGERARTSQVSECDRSSTKFLSTVHLQSKRVRNDPWPYTRTCNVALGTLRHCRFNQFTNLFLIIIRIDYSSILLFSLVYTNSLRFTALQHSPTF